MPNKSPQKITSALFSDILTKIRQTEIIHYGLIENIFADCGYRNYSRKRALRILVIRFDEIGDSILTIPFLASLRSIYPTAQISLLVREFVADIMQLCPYVNEVIPAKGWFKNDNLCDRFTWMINFCQENLWERHFDVAICPRWDMDDGLAIPMAFLSGAQIRIGYSNLLYDLKKKSYASLDNLLTDRVVNPDYVIHEVERNLFILKFMGHTFVNTTGYLQADSSSKYNARKLIGTEHLGKHLVAVAVAAREERRTYPPKMLADALMNLYKTIHGQQEISFVLLGSKEVSETGSIISLVQFCLKILLWI